jgi:Domain of unknown function (DUF4397)
MNRLRALAALVSVAALAACGEKVGMQEITAPAPGAGIKFFNFGTGAPNVNFYSDGTKISAVLSANGQEATSGTGQGAAASGGFYSVLSPGQHTFTGHIAAAVDSNLTIATVPGTLVDGKFYSLFLSGPYNTTTKTSDGFIVEDVLPSAIDATADYSGAYVRFVNAISNASAMTLYAKSTSDTLQAENTIGGPVAYKSASSFVKIPAGTYTLNTRVAGSSTNVITRTAVTFAVGRVYTIGARGDITVTGTTSANRPQLDNTANR